MYVLENVLNWRKKCVKCMYNALFVQPYSKSNTCVDLLSYFCTYFCRVILQYFCNISLAYIKYSIFNKYEFILGVSTLFILPMFQKMLSNRAHQTLPLFGIQKLSVSFKMTILFLSSLHSATLGLPKK